MGTPMLGPLHSPEECSGLFSCAIPYRQLDLAFGAVRLRSCKKNQTTPPEDGPEEVVEQVRRITKRGLLLILAGLLIILAGLN
jgi:hypothetical protein